MTSPLHQVAAIVTGAPAYVPPDREAVGGSVPGERPAPRPRHDDEPETGAPGWDEIEDGPSDQDIGPVDPEIVRGCAGLDHSDTDNATRLIRHSGQDIAVLAQEGTHGGDWFAWTGNHWDGAGGPAGVRMIAQRIGGRIALEAEHLAFTPDEQRTLAAAEPFDGVPKSELDDDAKPLVVAAERARKAMDLRRARRRNHGMTSKNKGRIEAMLDCAAPHLRRQPDSFNPDRLRFACLTHTITLGRELDQDVMPDGSPRYASMLDARRGHDRADWITSVVPAPWVPDAKAARWRAFLARMLPDPDKRRTVQQFSGLGLLGIPVQFIMFHYGRGANGKSVFLETLVRLLGPGLAVGLPRESIVGGSDRSSGGASPDLARLYGKRMVRILEVKGNVPLQEDLIKKLTGGEAFPVRTLFKGYFEFQSIATPHMSGNGKPSIDGTDEGIWRRMLLVHWDQTIAPADRGDFEEVVSEFVRDEGPGILAWLVEGARDYLANGLVIAPSVVGDTQEYRDEMDPIGLYTASCVRAEAGSRVQASVMFEGYVSWSMANAKKPASQQKFGRVMGERFHKSEIGGRSFYHDCALHDVPERPDDPSRTLYADRRG